MKFTRPTGKSIGIFTLTALPVAVVTALIVANIGSNEVAVEPASQIVDSPVVTTTTSAEQLVSTTTVLATTTTTAVPLELSKATVAVQSQPSEWKRISINQCGCSVEFPGAITQSGSSLPDGRPAHLVLSQSDGAISAALWTTTADVDADRTEEMVTVLNAIAGGAQLSNQTTVADRVQATMIDGATKAKIDVRSIGDKIVVLFIASSNGDGLDAASARYSASLRA